MQNLLKREQTQITQAIAIFKAQRNNTNRKVRLPSRHRSTKNMQLNFLIVGDRVYPFRVGGFEGSHVIATPLGNQGRLFRPANGRGILVRKGDLFRKYLKDFSSSQTFLSFWVYKNDNSYKTFQNIKEEALKQGFEYSVSPYANPKGIALYRGSPNVE